MRVDYRAWTAGAALAGAAAVLGIVLTAPAGASTPTAVPPSTGTTRPAHATVMASSVTPGQTAHVQGTGFRPGETVDAVLRPGPVSLGHFTANSSGDVAFSFTVPAEKKSATHPVVLTGETSRNTLTILVAIAAQEGTGTGAGSQGSTSVLSDTGTNASDVLVLALVTLACGLLLLGLGFTRREHVRLLRRGKH